MKCPNCGTEGTGNFCANCAAPLVGAACAACHAPLTPGAKFCYRCGTPAGAPSVKPSAAANALPWSVAAIALLSLLAMLARSEERRVGKEYRTRVWGVHDENR